MERILDLEPVIPRFKVALNMRVIMPVKRAYWEGGAQMYRKCLMSSRYMS